MLLLVLYLIEESEGGVISHSSEGQRRIGDVGGLWAVRISEIQLEIPQDSVGKRTRPKEVSFVRRRGNLLERLVVAT